MISVLSLLSSSGVGGSGRLGAKAATSGDDPMKKSFEFIKTNSARVVFEQLNHILGLNNLDATNIIQ